VHPGVRQLDRGDLAGQPALVGRGGELGEGGAGEGTALMISTPPAMATSYCPETRPTAAKWTDCWDDPHWRSAYGSGGDGPVMMLSAVLVPVPEAELPLAPG
jgi:hypothetical protein